MADIQRVSGPLVLQKERILFADASSQAVDLTLPCPNKHPGRQVTVHVEDITNGVTIDCGGTGTVEGESSLSFSYAGESRTWVAYDNDWKLIAKV